MNRYKIALDHIACKKDCSKCDIYDSLFGCMDGIDSALNCLKELVDKETPKKVAIWDNAETATRCPVCGRGVKKYGDDEYCPNCGQKLDWSKE